MHLSPPTVFRPSSKSDDRIRSRKRIHICVGVLGAGGAVLVAVGAVALVYLPHLIEIILTKERVISEESQTYELWREPPLPLFMNFYIFNITNYKDYLENNAKPILDEVGPYVYRQKWLKNKIHFHDNGTVSYVQNKTYYFDQSLSQGSENDLIFTINVPMLGAAWLFKNAGPVLKVVLTTVFTISHESFVMNLTVKELIWDGYDDPILKAFKTILPNARYPHNRFAFFYARNGSDEGIFNVFTGSKNISLLNDIDLWNGKSDVDVWDGACNNIKGTSGEFFPPVSSSEKSLSIFISDLCRSFSLEYTEPVEHYGIHGLHFQSSPKLFANASENPDNSCFCPGKCLPSGALNISECKWGTPIAISHPHFLYGDPRYINQVVGLKPNASKHKIYIDVEPRTGVLLDVKVRMQVNAILEKISGISHFEHVNNTVFPLFWFEQKVNLNDDIIQLLRVATITAFLYANVASYVTMTIGALMILIGLAVYYRQRNSNKKMEQ